VDELPHVKLSGDLEGDYVVLAQRAGGVLKIAAAQPDGLPRVVDLKRTTWACPTQWEGRLEDGRTLYARCRHGELSVGIGAGLDAAVANGMSKDALCSEYVEDGSMSFEELRAHLYGLLEFPTGLKAEEQKEPSLNLKAFGEIFAAEKSADPNPAKADDDGGETDERDERLGGGLREAEIQDWTCFSCGDALTQAHEGDYSHTDSENECVEEIPVPTSLVKISLQR